jgi:hypothetical protein
MKRARAASTAVLLLPCILAAALVSVSNAQNIKGEIVEFGTYTVVERKGNVPVPSGSGQPVHITKAIRFLETTNRIVAQKGLSFGFRYRLTGLPTNAAVVLDVATIHPEFTLPDGKKDTGRVLHIECKSTDGTWTHNVGYRFDDDHEMVDGEWRFSISYKTRNIITKTFHVVRK